MYELQMRHRHGRTAATRIARHVLLATLLPLSLAAQDTRRVALLRGLTGVEPEPGSLLATPARLTVVRLPLVDALEQLSERTRVQVAFSPSLLPVGYYVDCECGALNMARALDQLLAGTDLGYLELGSQVVVVPRGKPEIPGPNEEIRGRVRTAATLTGVVRYSVDLEPIASAQITVAPTDGEAVTAIGVSDRFGAFVVPELPAAGPVRVELRAFGYEVWTRNYDPLPSDPIRVLLTPAPIGLEGLGVGGSGRPGDPMSLSRDAFVINSVVLRSLPMILETDVLRATAVSPSASASSDYASIPFIRGGTSDGTPVLLDGVRLFNAFHFGGIISAINPEVVKRTSLLATSGGDGLGIGSLSGAIEMATRDGSRDRRRVAGSLGLTSLRLSVEGPIGERVSYLVGGRRMHVDGLTLALKYMGIMDGHFPYFFQDLHAKVTTDLGGVRRLSVSGYMNSESVNHSENIPNEEIRETAFTLGNAAFSAHYRDRLGASGIVDANLGHSRFGSDLIYREQRFFAVDNQGNRYRPPPDTRLVGDGSMSETRADLRVTWHAGRTTIMAGTQATRFHGDHDYLLGEFLDGGNAGAVTGFLSSLALRESLWRLAAYSLVEIPLRRGFSTRAGLRVDRFRSLATTLAPFAELSYAASWWDARVSATRSYQALASLRNEEARDARLAAYDLLVPIREAPVPRNTEFSIGWEGSRGGLRVRLDAYTRTLDHLRLADRGANPARGTVLVDPSLWELATGTARGIEASWSWMWDRGISVLGSYRWAKASRTVGSRTYTPRFHRDHELELGSSFRHGRSLWSARVALRSGQPDTPWLAIVPGSGYRGWPNRVLLGGEYNSVKLPHYARIDVGWRRESEFSWFGGGTVMPYVAVANLINRQNVVGWWPVGINKRYRRQLPIFPFIGVEFRF